MSTPGSVTHWLAELKAGEESALERLHARYWPYLVGLARKKLAGAPRRVADEEDVAQEAIISFYQSFKAGAVPRLENRHDFVALLTVIAIHKATDQIDRQNRAKRGGGHVQGESALEMLADSGSRDAGLAQIEDPRRPPPRTPEEEAILNDCYRYFIDKLPPGLRDVAERYLAGFTASEIAEIKGCSKRTAERKIHDVLEELHEMARDDGEGKNKNNVTGTDDEAQEPDKGKNVQ